MRGRTKKHVVLLLQLQQQAILLSNYCMQLLQQIHALPWRKTKKLKHRVRRVSVTKKIKKVRRVLGPRERWSVLEEEDFDCYAETGLFYDQFLAVLERTKGGLLQARTGQKATVVSLTCDARLLLLLNFLREGGTYRRVAKRFNVSKSFVCREVHHGGPVLCASLSVISWPLHWIQYVDFENVSAAIDGTPHFRVRTHPRQADFYRGDKHAFFWNAQVVVSIDGDILNVQLLMGHNNDQGSFNQTAMAELLERLQLLWLADKGYHHHRLVKPNDAKSATWNNRQKGLRSIVEVVIGLVKNFVFAAQTVRLSPELHACLLIAIYELTQLVLREYPIRFLQRQLLAPTTAAD